jgi:hypothetical protein
MAKLLAFAAALAACLALCRAGHLQAVATLDKGQGFCYVSGNNNTRVVDFAVRCAARLEQLSACRAMANAASANRRLDRYLQLTNDRPPTAALPTQRCHLIHPRPPPAASPALPMSA